MNKSKHITITRDSIVKNSPSHLDQQGQLFTYKGQYHRYINSSCADLFRELIDKHILQDLQQNHHLITSDITSMRVTDDPGSLVLKHKTLWPLTFPNEWSPSMLYDAAKLTLELMLALNKYNLMLQDAHPWNIVFDGSQATFIDLTSITKTEPKLIWPAHEQFLATFHRPITLNRKHKGFCVRALMQAPHNGITLSQFYTLLPIQSIIRHPSIPLSLWIEKKIQKNTKLKDNIRKQAEKITKDIPQNIRKSFLTKLLKNLGPPPQLCSEDRWKHYYQEVNILGNVDTKKQAIATILKRIKPKTVLDIGCNTGVFSIEAAHQGAQVIAMDSSEICVDQLYLHAKKNKLPITPIIANISTPTPETGTISTSYASLTKRINADCVLFLGIMHHIHLVEQQPLASIIKTLASLTKHQLIFEFIAMDDANIDHLPKRRHIHYTLDSIINDLKAFFPNIECISSDRKTRQLLLCQK